jgi:hypothetical protein
MGRLRWTKADCVQHAATTRPIHEVKGMKQLLWGLQDLDSESIEHVAWMARAGRMQWRGSPDGIVWGSWSILTHIEMPLPCGSYFAVQARIWDGVDKWHTSPIEVLMGRDLFGGADGTE